MTSLFCSASTTASWTHFIAVSKSTISPLRTPRDGACPTPRILIVPSGRLSPTTTQIFEVPISKPDHQIITGHYYSFFLSEFVSATGIALADRFRFRLRCRRRWRRCRFRRRSATGIAFMIRGVFAFGIDRVVDHFRGGLRERDRNVALHEQIDGLRSRASNRRHKREIARAAATASRDDRIRTVTCV